MYFTMSIVNVMKNTVFDPRTLNVNIFIFPLINVVSQDLCLVMW